MFLGILLSVIVSILFAIYAVPRKFTRQNPVLYTMWMGLAYFVGAVVLCAILWGSGISEFEDLGSPWHLLSILRGVIWVIGMVSFNLAIDKIGLTRFNQWKNLQGPIGSILMLTLLTDIAGEKIIWIIAGMLVMFVSAFFLNVKNENDTKKTTLSGIMLAVLAAVCFGATAFLSKWITGQGFIYSQLLFHSLSVTISALVIYLVMERKPKEIFRVDKKTWLPVLTGTMFLVATTLSILSYTMIAGSVAWSITQLNAMWTILIGVFVFKEVSFKKHWVRITAGFIFAIGAIVLLFFAL